MKVHPRMFAVQKAQADMDLLLLDFRSKHDLTDIEFLQCLNYIGQSTLKYMLRTERHPNNPDKRADEL